MQVCVGDHIESSFIRIPDSVNRMVRSKEPLMLPWKNIVVALFRQRVSRHKGPGEERLKAERVEQGRDASNLRNELFEGDFQRIPLHRI